MNLPVPDPLRRLGHARRVQIEALKLETPGYRLRERLGSIRPAGRLERPLRRGGAGEAVRLLCAITCPEDGTSRDAVALARRCEAGGATALALTPLPDGGAASLAVVDAVRAACPLPLLLADPVGDEYQLLDAAVRGADGALMVASLLSDVQLQVLVGTARLLGLDPLVVAEDHDQLKRALAAGSTLVGLGRPDLPGAPGAAASSELVAVVPPLVTAVAWGDFSAPTDIARLRADRWDAARTGASLEASPDPAAGIAALVRAARG